jgi:hypothetical protein
MHKKVWIIPNGRFYNIGIQRWKDDKFVGMHLYENVNSYDRNRLTRLAYTHKTETWFYYDAIIFEFKLKG